nr:unnamed protein product [Spirometra erinaceieuropaei]
MTRRWSLHPSASAIACHQHVLLVSPPGRDKVQQVPMSRSKVHPGGLPSHRDAEEATGQDESFCAGSKHEQAIIVEAIETMGTQHSSPGSMVCTDADVNVAEDNQLFRLRHGRKELVQVLVGFVPCLVGAGHRRAVDADDVGEFASLERQVETHQAIVDTLRQTGQSSHDVIPDGKGDVRVPSPCSGRPLQKKVCRHPPPPIGFASRAGSRRVQRCPQAIAAVLHSGRLPLRLQLASRYPNSSLIISPDDYLGPWRPSRVLSRTDLSDALAACKQAAWSAMRSKTLFIIVDKDNLKYADMLPYVSELGYFEMLESSRKNNFRVTRSRFPASNNKRSRAPPTWKRSRQVPNDVMCGNQGAPLPVDSNLCSLEDVLLEETAVRLSIEEQKKHFEIPLNQSALNALSQQFPGIDREILMETLVRCGFDLETSIACIVAGVLDKDSFAEASRMSAFEANVVPPTALKTPNPNDGGSLDKDEDLSFQEILDEEEAISRSVADQSKSMQTLAVQLTLKRLASQFPGFEKPYLINLFIKSGMDEDATRQHLAEHGRAAEPLPPFTTLVPVGSPAATRPPASVTVSSLPLAKESLATLEEEIDGIRRSIKGLHDVRLGAKSNSVHPGVVAFYNEELRTLRCRLNHREDLHRDLLVAIRSQEHALAAVGRERADSKSSTRAGLAFLDLHGLKLHHAMIALRRRLALLESGCPTTPTAAAIVIAPCPNFWLPKRLTVVTGWGSHSSSQSLGLTQPYSVIRASVLNFLRSRSYDFSESPYIGCGRFEIKLMHRTAKQAKRASNVSS